MINTSELARRPVKERDLIPLATEEQAVRYFQRQIEYCRISAISPIHAPHLGRTADLLSISGEEEFSIIGGDILSNSLTRIERTKAQELLFKVMTTYGFDETKSEFYYRSTEVSSDGTTRRTLVYPSQTIKGLEFELTRDFVTETGQTTDVQWYAREQRSGWKADLRNVFRRNPKPQIKRD